MKLDLYQCDRCGETVEHKKGTEPITVKQLDGRYPSEVEETSHLCDDCYSTFLIAMNTEKKCREAFDKLADKHGSVLMEE